MILVLTAFFITGCKINEESTPKENDSNRNTFLAESSSSQNFFTKSLMVPLSPDLTKYDGMFYRNIDDANKEETENDKQEIYVKNKTGEKEPIISFKGTIDRIENGKMYVDCSDAVNRAKTGPIPSIGYSCSTTLESETKFIGENNEQVDKTQIEIEQYVEVVLQSPEDINEDAKSRNVIAKEIRIIDAN